MAPMQARAWSLQALALEQQFAWLLGLALEQQLAWLLGSCQSQGDPAPPQVPQPSPAAPTSHDTFALIPIRTMASEMASGAGSSSAGRSPSALRMASTFARN